MSNNSGEGMKSKEENPMDIAIRLWESTEPLVTSTMAKSSYLVGAMEAVKYIRNHSQFTPIEGKKKADVDYWMKKYKEANEFICDVGKLLGEDGLGWDDITWTLEDFEAAIKNYQPAATPPASNDKGCMRWVKCSDRLPEKQYNYHVKVEYQFMPNKPGIWNTASLWNCDYWEHPYEYEYGKPKKLNVIEWLDESASPTDGKGDAVDMNEFFNWWRKQGYHFDGINFDDNPGHDDFQNFTPQQLYNLFKQQKNE